LWLKKRRNPSSPQIRCTLSGVTDRLDQQAGLLPPVSILRNVHLREHLSKVLVLEIVEIVEVAANPTLYFVPLFRGLKEHRRRQY
jgi:hypothetical protein